MALTLYKGTTSRLGLIGLKDADDAAVTNATVTAVLRDRRNNDTVTGQSWPLTLTHDSDGNYYGNLDDAIAVKVGKIYFAEITAISGSLKAFWREKVECTYAPV